MARAVGTKYTLGPKTSTVGRLLAALKCRDLLSDGFAHSSLYASARFVPNASHGSSCSSQSQALERRLCVTWILLSGLASCRGAQCHDVQQHLITNSLDSVARLARVAQRTRDFIEFVVKPYLDIVGVQDDFMVDWHTDMLVRAWRLARRQQRLRRHDGSPVNLAGREPRQRDPVTACHDALYVVNRIAGVVHRIDGTSTETPRRTICNWHFGDVRATKSSRLPQIRRACTVCFQGVLSPSPSQESSSEDDDL